MNHEDIVAIIREFPDRSMQWLLETPENVRGLLKVVASDLAEGLDFTRLTPLRRSFVPDDLRKREADIIFLAPFLEQKGGTKSEVIIYILIEHQSTPDPMMRFRVLFYMVQAWESQRREWEDKKTPLEERRFRPILPVVFYTGSLKWECPLDMKSLMDIPAPLEQFVPRHETLFLNLKAADPDSLVKDDHPFGWVLRVIQKEDSSIEEMEDVLTSAIEHLEAMSEEDRVLWEKLMRFLVMLVYHRRAPKEQRRLVEVIETKVKDVSRREEVQKMGKTIAQALIEEGKELGVREGRELGVREGKELGVREGKRLGIREGQKLGAARTKREDLTRLLRSKFGDDAARIVEKVEAIEDVNRLDALFERALYAHTLEEIEMEEQQ